MYPCWYDRRDRESQTIEDFGSIGRQTPLRHLLSRDCNRGGDMQCVLSDVPVDAQSLWHGIRHG